MKHATSWIGTCIHAFLLLHPIRTTAQSSFVHGVVNIEEAFNETKARLEKEIAEEVADQLDDVKGILAQIALEHDE
jgi:hypothetical protein